MNKITKHALPAVLFLVFNRPDATSKVFEAIRAAKPIRLYVASDGPRPDRIGEDKIVEFVRQLATDIDWPCELKTYFRPLNVGCKQAVASAIDWFFVNESEGIILEDDCLPCPDFFNFCAELLERYRDDQRIGAICGTNLYNLNAKAKITNDMESYYFSKGASVWGWATWRRVWKDYDSKIATWEKLRDSKAFKSNFRRRKWKLLTRSFNSVFEGRVDTWDYQFGHLLLTTNRLCATPNINLIENIGFDKNATHTKSKIAAEGHNHADSLSWPLVHPLGIFPSAFKDNYLDVVYSSRLRRFFVSLLSGFKR